MERWLSGRKHRLAKAASGQLLRGFESLFLRHNFFAPVAQLDRVSDYESEGRAFESLRVRHFPFYLFRINELNDINNLTPLRSPFFPVIARNTPLSLSGSRPNHVEVL